MTVSVRAAVPDDIPFLVGLATDPDVASYLAAGRVVTVEAFVEQIARSEAEPDAYGLVVFELDGERAGPATWELVNRGSRIAAVSGIAVDPSLRGRGVGVAGSRALQTRLFRDLGLHRLQMEVYAFNDRGLRHAERAGWVREGICRRAYWRDGEWVDGILFGLLEDELDG
jgi:RimJ/RimL family protein N-acetyltransferase